MTRTEPIRTCPGGGCRGRKRLPPALLHADGGGRWQPVAPGSGPLAGEVLAGWERMRPSRKRDRVGGASRPSILKPGDSICISGFT